VLSRLQPFKVSGEEDSLTLATCFWLDNKRFSLLIIELGFKILSILGKKPRFWEEIEVTGASLFYRHQVLRQQVLSGKGIHTWEVIRALI
jgi:hypothetical protein